MNKHAPIASFSLALILLFLTACGNGTPAPTPVGVDIRFREFYDLKGGPAVLGKPVSGILNQGDTQRQIFENVIIVYRSSAPAGEQFDFLQVGHYFVAEDNTPDGLVIAGQTSLGRHILYDEFGSMFNRMGGLRFVGSPLTSVRRNDEAGRYEQFFEKMGFYRLYSDPPGQVRLLPYGLYECHRNQALGCNSNVESGFKDAIVSEPLLPIMNRLGALPGKPISPVYLALDGKFEQVYENVVVVFDAQSPNPRTIGLRPLPERIGLKRQPLAAPVNDEDLSFWEIENNRGYNVLKDFLKYIAAHGSTELSGPPISEVFESKGLRVQCFTNYCLAFDPAVDKSRPVHEKVRPLNLGYEYLKAQTFSVPVLLVRAWEEFQYIEPGKTQVVHVSVYNQASGTPVDRLQPTLAVTLEDGSSREYTFPPTSQAGISSLEVGGVQAIGLVVYEVCVGWPGGEPVCVRESWVVR